MTTHDSGLDVTTLSIDLGGTRLVEDVSFRVPPGSRFGFVGGSGSGKSLTLRALVGLLPAGATVSGRVTWDGDDILDASDRTLARIRGRQIGLILQDPATALDPLRRIGPQIVEGGVRHGVIERSMRRTRAIELAGDVGLASPERIIERYPHELSGGQRQRVQIAAALSARPRLLLADEPTTALDTVVQSRILDLLSSLTGTAGVSTLFVTHDLAVLARVAESAAVFDRGRIVEHSLVTDLLTAPESDAARTLLDAARSTSWTGGQHG